MVADDDLIHNVLSEDSGQSSFACTHCRRQKVKCDRVLPTCGNCSKASRICAYPLTVQKPGPKAGTHRRPRASVTEAQNNNEPSNKRTKYEGTAFRTDDWHGPDASPGGTYELRAPLNSAGRRESSSTAKSPHGESALHRVHNPLFRIVHPDHEPCENRSKSAPKAKGADTDAPFEETFAASCAHLQVSVAQGWELLTTYFNNMTAFSLFHRPTFDAKLRSIAGEAHLTAFLSPIFAFSLRFADSTTLAGSATVSTSRMLETAYSLHLECLAELGDDDCPFYLLQSLTLVAWQKLILGVRSESWRLLGDCVRIAMLLKLSMIDIDAVNADIRVYHNLSSETWIGHEEKRRLWWTLWELDIFASTIRRLPALIDDRFNLTFLPVHDDDWFNGTESRSCFLAPNATQRWRSLADCGNKSPTAWFILVNSYMFDSSKMGIFPEIWAAKMAYKPSDSGEVDFSDRKKMLPKMRDFLDNCLRCAFMSLPTEISCDNRFLAFRPSTSNTAKSTRMLDAGRYSVHIMMQLARIMLYVWDVHHISATQQPNEEDTPHTDMRSNPSATPGYEVKTERQIWERYLDASHLIADMIRNTSATHYQFVNPLLANTIWIAAAALIVARLFGPEDSDQRLAASNFDLFVATLNKFETFWNVPSVLKVKLSGLEDSIKRIALLSRDGSQAPDEAAPDSSYNDNKAQSQPQPQPQPKTPNPNPNNLAELNGTPNDTQSIASGIMATGNIYAGFNGFDMSTDDFNLQGVPAFGTGQGDMAGSNLYDAFFDSLNIPENNSYNFNELFMYP